ncbi:LLM class flavin-dependent oxidoreductase [Sphaerisporangium sp. TRM90804]|uniref:LLM class flavin-dependent oxidoreductase n=1 Tax=Sphaerisporangium sp. TRM90804 TaxID=3031113 RepID=UPI002446EC47|nr:LLM class flavin-dependent oxidoreductase [Sphaerisporangium sp. TRM90804]MDH2426518.1 LLM class flavin-dependent oxidoreductase [Sphaerisporangium sp. TRM90804]
MAENPRSALWFPLFDELADPLAVARLAAEAEEAGWDGFFVWDRLTWPAPVERIADPWISLAAAATATESLRLGPMVTPVARRRPAKLARETASLDRLSGGRLTLGVGLGGDLYGAELARTGEQVDDRVRAEMLDEALGVLTSAWSGRPVRHRGPHYVIDDLTFLPTPVQPRVPIWAAGYAGRRGPLRRAATLDGFFPVELRHPDQLAEIGETIHALRPDPTAPYDLAVPLPPGTDPTAYAAAGATWCLTEFDPDAMTLDHIRGVLQDGPALPAAQEVTS